MRSEIRKLADPEKAAILQRFFKTGRGDYAEGDIFIGVAVPDLRKLSKKHGGMSLRDAVKLLRSRIHEERMIALLILLDMYRKSGADGKEKIFRAYLGNTGHINNWDLVDISAKHIVGDYLADRQRSVLYRLARSPYLWERRIAILSTFHFIERRQFEDTLAIALALIKDEHDLIHKAVGWMLREVGKRDMAAEERFLQKYHGNMPRTMLRYAIERFPERKRRRYLNASRAKKGGAGCR